MSARRLVATLAAGTALVAGSADLVTAMTHHTASHPTANDQRAATDTGATGTAAVGLAAAGVDLVTPDLTSTASWGTALTQDPPDADPGSEPGSGSDPGSSSGSASGSGSDRNSAPGRDAQPDPEPEPDPAAAPPTPEPAGPDPAARAAELARQRATKAAAQLAAARQRATNAWANRGRPERLLLIRAATIDVVSGGRLINQIRRTAPVSTMYSLGRVVPDGWVRHDGDAATLATMVVLSPGVTLDLSGPRTVRLAGGPTPAQAAIIQTGSGRLVARNVTVTSADPATGRPMPPAAGRPYIAVARSGRLDATDATFSDLGTLPDDAERHGGVQFNEGSSGSLVRTAMARNTTGLRLSAARGVRLDGLTVTESGGDGLVLQGDTGTTLRAVRAERNGGNGVLVQDDSADRVITEIATTGNQAFGVAVVGQVRPRIAGVTTTADRSGGLRLGHVSDALITDFVARDQPIGVFTHVGSTGVVFERMRITGGRRGLVIEKSTTGLRVRDGVIDRVSSVGASLGGKDTALDRVTVTGSRTAVRAERGASDVRATGLRISGGEDGFVANPGSSGVVLRDLTAAGVGNDAVRTYSPDTRIEGGRISGADTGIVAASSATVNDTEITQVHTGLRSRGGVPMAADRVAVAALTVGVDAAPGSPVELRASRVHALQALRGDVRMDGPNDLSLPPLNLLGAIGVPLIILAVLLEMVHAVRQRKFHAGGRRTPPGRLPPLAPAGA